MPDTGSGEASSEGRYAEGSTCADAGEGCSRAAVCKISRGRLRVLWYGSSRGLVGLGKGSWNGKEGLVGVVQGPGWAVEVWWGFRKGLVGSLRSRKCLVGGWYESGKVLEEQ